MAEEEETENEEAASGGGRGKKLLVVGAVVVLALVVGAAGTWWFLWAGGEEPAQATAGDEASAQSDKAEEPGELYKMDEFVVNLARSSRTRYLKTTLQLELDDQSLVKKVEKRQPQIRDALIILLSNQSVDGLEQMEGKYQLKRQVVARLNNLLGDDAVRNVYFTEFVIQ
ncbi:flagellar basal body-associated FliL family protein [Thiohalorhabdus sp.]|uniref:flagellar basal body-associated FliL family protein n=1 Tax=Thiohalorhabdus sp. TaxID=3094134 RepID=UPI002FC3225D